MSAMSCAWWEAGALVAYVVYLRVYLHTTTVTEVWLDTERGGLKQSGYNSRTLMSTYIGIVYGSTHITI